MKKTVICDISMKENIDKVLYTSDDRSLPVSDRKVSYPITAFLEKTMKKEDDLNVILLVKQDKFGNYKKNMEIFKEELDTVNNDIGASIEYDVINTAFDETKAVHEQLMGQIVERIPDNEHVLVDITYGPKDLPIVIFAALSFAEKHLGCTIDNIIYGKANFENGRAVDTKICDMVPLYYLQSLSNTIHSSVPGKAREALRSLLSM